MQTLKHIFIGWLATFIAIAAQAQNEQDFASRFMSLYAHQSTLQCTTVSPLMLERMMQLLMWKKMTIQGKCFRS